MVRTLSGPGVTSFPDPDTGQPRHGASPSNTCTLISCGGPSSGLVSPHAELINATRVNSTNRCTPLMLLLRQLEDVECVAVHRHFDFWNDRAGHLARAAAAVTGRDGDVLLAVRGERHRVAL